MKYILTKRNPVGELITLSFDTEKELEAHLMAMWNFTDGYSLVSVFLAPNK